MTKKDTIQLHCRNCHSIHTLDRTLEAPHNAARMESNWCPDCEDEATDYYKDWYIRKYERQPVDKAQLEMQF